MTARPCGASTQLVSAALVLGFAALSANLPVATSPPASAAWNRGFTDPLSETLEYSDPDALNSRRHVAIAMPLLTFSPSVARNVQNDNDEINVMPPNVRKARCSALVTAA
jgi:hypothetical protein